MTAVAVAGSANLDLVITVARRPTAGETTLGSGYAEAVGGKGVNQAIAAAKVAPTAFIGAVGRDAAGTRIARRLEQASVSVDHLRRADLPTGRAVVTVTPDAQNAITVVPMANGAVDPDEVRDGLDRQRPTTVLCQLEIPIAAVSAAADWARSASARFVLNASPVTGLDAVVLAQADPLIVNVGEAEALLDCPPGSVSPGLLALRLLEVAASAVVTVGAAGAHVAGREGLLRIPGIAVEPRDTTGAGDVFAGTMAAHLALGAGLQAAAEAANGEAARTVRLARSER